jgi:Domain of unknown function (DUF1788)
MSSLKADFDELRDRIRQGRDLGNAGFEPVYYLVFPPSAIIEVKRQTPAWVARLKQDGWQVTEFSVAQAIEEIFAADPRLTIWQGADQRAPLAWGRTNESLTNAVTGPKGLLPRIEAQLAALDGKQNHLLLVTDLEALHPYVRIGSIEGQLLGRFKVPTIFLYPGQRTGRTGLKFLGFYPSDGNYRSVHVGG